jgi:hypothetical protein
MAQPVRVSPVCRPRPPQGDRPPTGGRQAPNGRAPLLPVSLVSACTLCGHGQTRPPETSSLRRNCCTVGLCPPVSLGRRRRMALFVPSPAVHVASLSTIGPFDRGSAEAACGPRAAEPGLELATNPNVARSPGIAGVRKRKRRNVCSEARPCGSIRVPEDRPRKQGVTVPGPPPAPASSLLRRPRADRRVFPRQIIWPYRRRAALGLPWSAARPTVTHVGRAQRCIASRTHD